MAVSSGLRKSLIVATALVCAFALLVGYAHWYVHDLETGDVAWSAPAYGRPDRVEVVVVGGRIYSYDGDRLVIRDLRTGRPIATTRARGAQAYIGDGGQMAVTDAPRHRLAFYSRDGRELWHRGGGRIGTPLAIGADGGLDVMSCAHRLCQTVHYDDAGRVTARTARRSRDLARAAMLDSPINRFEEVHPAVFRVPPVPIDIDGHRAYQLRDGRPWGTAVATTDGHTLAQVGDLLVGLSRRGGTCVFEAVRSGRRAWTTSTPCPDLGAPALTVFAHRLYAYTEDDDYRTNNGADVVSTDLDGVRAVHTYIRRPVPLTAGGYHLEPTPRALIFVTTRTVGGYSPTTGAKLWQQDLHHNSGYTDDAGHQEKAGASGVIAKVVRDTRPPWPRLAIGHDTPPRTFTLLDPVTGDTMAGLAASPGTEVRGTADGDAIAFDNDRVRLIRP